MHILITGCDGAIGKEITNLLINKTRHKLYLFTNKKFFKNKKKNKSYYQDLTKPINYKLKIDIVIHCAAKNPLSKLNNSSRNLYSKNIKMTKNLIKFSNKNSVKKIIFLSAMDVYGQIKSDFLFENQKPINPNLYGQSKSQSEKLFCDKKNKFKTICLRIPGIFTSELTRDRPLIIGILKKIINNEKVYAYNLNKKFNNILDANEIVKFIKAILRKKIKSEIYNFSASRPIKFIYVINLMKKIFKSKSRIISESAKKNSFIISNRKIQNHFDFKISDTKKIINRCCKKIIAKRYKFA